MAGGSSPFRSSSSRSRAVKAVPLLVKGSMRMALPFTGVEMYLSHVAGSTLMENFICPPRPRRTPEGSHLQRYTRNPQAFLDDSRFGAHLLREGSQPRVHVRSPVHRLHRHQPPLLHAGRS